MSGCDMINYIVKTTQGLTTNRLLAIFDPLALILSPVSSSNEAFNVMIVLSIILVTLIIPTESVIFVPTKVESCFCHSSAFKGEITTK